MIFAQWGSIVEVEDEGQLWPVGQKKARSHLESSLQGADKLQDSLFSNRKCLQDWNALCFSMVLDFFFSLGMFIHSWSFSVKCLWYSEKRILYACVCIYLIISKRNKMPRGSSSENFLGNFQADWKGSPKQHFLKYSVGSNLGKTVPWPNTFGVTLSSPFLETFNVH